MNQDPKTTSNKPPKPLILYVMIGIILLSLLAFASPDWLINGAFLLFGLAVGFFLYKAIQYWRRPY